MLKAITHYSKCNNTLQCNAITLQCNALTWQFSAIMHCSTMQYIIAAIYYFRVTVSVISLEGADCKLVHLGVVSQITGGIVEIVDQAKVNDRFGNILTSRTLATDVTVRLCLHHSL